MKIKPIAPNQTEVTTDKAVVLFSYETPVAALVDGVAYRTSEFWSVTTSKHINKWFDGIEAEVKPQSFFDNLS